MGITKSVAKYCYWGTKACLAGAPIMTVCGLAVKECLKDIAKGNSESVAYKIAFSCGLPVTGIGTIGTFLGPEALKTGAGVTKLGVRIITSPYNAPAMGLDYCLGEFKQAVFGHKCPVSAWSPASEAETFSEAMTCAAKSVIDE